MRVRAALAGLVLVLLAWPWVAPRYFVFLASLVLVNALVAIGLNLLSGYTNQLSFGHAGFLAIGVGTAAVLWHRARAFNKRPRTAARAQRRGMSWRKIR